MYINPFQSFHTSVTAMKTKSDLHLFSPFGFTWRGVKKDLTASMLDQILSYL